jgi:hypothetical protein
MTTRPEWNIEQLNGMEHDLESRNITDAADTVADAIDDGQGDENDPDRRRLVAFLLTENSEMTGAEIGRRLNITRQHGARLKREVQDAQPATVNGHSFT